MALLQYKDGYFFFHCKHSEQGLAKAAKFRWHDKRACWFTTKMAYAHQLEEFADYSTKKAIELGTDALEKSTALSCNREFPSPEGKEYLPHQKAGIEWCVERDVALIADPPGLGKTIQAIGRANHAFDVENHVPFVLVVCPASLKVMWQRKFQEWAIYEHTSYIVSGRKDIVPFWEDIIIINYDLLVSERIVEQLQTLKFDIGIFDESHFLKSPKAKRTKAVLSKKNGIAKNCKIKLFMTGTPILNRPIELFTLLASQSPATIAPYTDYYKFARRFCGGFQSPFGFVADKATNMEDLNLRLRNTLMIRRDKHDAIKDLPEKIIDIVPLGHSKATQKIAIEEEKINKEDLSLSKYTDTSVGELVTMRREMAEAKLPACIDYIKNMLNSGVEKIVVFAYHKSVIEGLQEGLREYKPVVLTGSTSSTARQNAVDDFQEEKEIRVFIGNIQAAGVGITLTAASNVVFVESSWVPGEIEQASDRCHRIGQNETVFVQFLVVIGSIEEHMLRSVLNKEENISKIMK